MPLYHACPQDAQWTAEEASLNFDTNALYANWVRTMSDMQATGCIPTEVQFSLEPPYGTCCSPTLNQLHPTIFQCSPMSNYSDTFGSVSTPHLDRMHSAISILPHHSSYARTHTHTKHTQIPYTQRNHARVPHTPV